jgi:hypothetical protein
MENQCLNDTKQFESERDEWIGYIDKELEEIEPKLEYWKNLASEGFDDLHDSPYLDPHMLANFDKAAQCPTVQRMHLSVQQCCARLCVAIVDAKKSIEYKEGLLKSKRMRLEGYKQRVTRQRDALSLGLLAEHRSDLCQC